MHIHRKAGWEGGFLTVGGKLCPHVTVLKIPSLNSDLKFEEDF